MTTSKKSTPNYDLKKVADVKSRVAKNTLTKDDQIFLKELLDRTEQGAKAKSIAGRPIVARLPFGMDIIK